MIYFVGEKGILDSTYEYKTVQECLEYFKNHDSIAVDTETEGRDCHSKKTLALQIGDKENQFVIDVRSTNIIVFKELLENKLCILHNAKFDYKFLKKAGIVVEHIYDTMLAECVIYCGYEKFGYSLKDVCLRYTGVDLDKSTRGEFFKIDGKPFTDKQIQYAALDVAYLHTIKEKQEILAKQYDLEYCVNLENQVVKALADIEYNGMYLNREKWLNNALEYNTKTLDMVKELDSIILNDALLKPVYKPKYIQADLFGEVKRELDINYGSPLQIKKIFSVLGQEVLSTDDRALSKLVKIHPFFSKLQEYREYSKVVSTYGEGFLDYINKYTNRVHTDFWQIKNTGRVSSGSKDMNSPNLQNIPADNKFRNCFEAREGFLWVSIDYSGQELRLMADGSGEEGFIDVLNSGEDLHCYAGSMMFKKKITKEDKVARNKAKTINFGKPYGMGSSKLADTLSISIEEAEELFEEYAKAFPKLNSWLKAQSRFAKENMYSKTFAPCNRRRWYPELKEVKELRKIVQKGDKETWKKILQTEGQVERNGGNQPIQGTGADITKEALVETRSLIKRYNQKYNAEVAYLICTVHDAIDSEVRTDLAEEFAKEKSEIMIICGNKYVSKVNMEVDLTITKVWQK